MKITTSINNIKSFGGLNFISAEFDKLKLPELITQHLGKRSIYAKFSYSDATKNLWVITFAGGDCAEDIHTNLKGELIKICFQKLFVFLSYDTANLYRHFGSWRTFRR